LRKEHDRFRHCGLAECFPQHVLIGSTTSAATGKFSVNNHGG
jgi:hypothetical protein